MNYLIVTVILILLEQICFLYIPLSDVEILEHRRKEIVNFPKKQNFIFQSPKVIPLTLQNYFDLLAAGQAFSGVFYSYSEMRRFVKKGEEFTL